MFNQLHYDLINKEKSVCIEGFCGNKFALIYCATSNNAGAHHN